MGEGTTTVPGARPTIVDVASAAGVSRQTVSNVLNRPDRVAPDTLERVQREIDRLGFTPHVSAQQLRRKRAWAYGFEVNPSGHRRMGHILDEFLVELTVSAPSHTSHLVAFAPDPDDVVAGYRQTLASGLVDGFVLADTRPSDPRPPWLIEHAVPFVSFGRVWDQPELTRWVDVDGAAGVRGAVHHLVDAGYRQVGFLGWPAGSPVGDDRWRGWNDALMELGLDESAPAAASVQDIDEATDAAEELLGRLGPDAAIVCASDLLALGALRAVRNRGLRPGADIGVVGFDDTDVAAAMSLTSVHQPVADAARIAWDMLVDPARHPGPVLLEPTLTIRSSSLRGG
ncbi:LacI family DNA-binding transcriptional regulator [Intrasporangium sp. YIM S08009]|uniref:LacI family DNA-binding transcriptional regulator n=1 Tax=Intrasporangium zincisolvens TaxID=3080018 RepID=UPI002B05562E|nr:LacI family DNA-binding transcriptional regulator [Intrasporangium sp. YIM S08009]